MNFYVFRKTAPYLMLAVFLLILDRFAKILFHVYFVDKSFSLCGDILSIRLATNKFIAFSIPIGGFLLEVFIALIIIFFIVMLIYFIKQKQLLMLSLLVFIIFGAISNLYDRVLLGYVIDYIDLKWFTVFNIADAMIVVPAAIMIIKYKKRPFRPI